MGVASLPILVVDEIRNSRIESIQLELNSIHDISDNTKQKFTDIITSSVHYHIVYRLKVQQVFLSSPLVLLSNNYATSGSVHYNSDVTAITFINDDFKGGELSFPTKPLKIKPVSGLTIIFPSAIPYDLASNNGISHMIIAYFKVQ